MTDQDFKERINSLVNEFNESRKKEALLKYPMNLQIYNKANSLNYSDFSKWLNEKIKIHERLV